MKNRIYCLMAILLFITTVQGQITGPVVTTPATDALLTEKAAADKASWLEQLKLSLEQSKLLLDAKEAVEIVSGAVAGSVQVKRLVERQNKCQKLLGDFAKNIETNDYANAITESTTSEMLDIVLELEDNIVQSTKILSSKFFKMGDAERLDMLRELNKEAAEIEAKIYRLDRKNRRYNRLYSYYSELED
ncbi:MAG: hypothetical protein AAF717_22370 [Bacteroidota bacterium]